jgi:hypothetical protein
MRTADSYRKTAAELKVKAGKERSPNCWYQLAPPGGDSSGRGFRVRRPELDLSVEFGPKLGADGEGEGA